jgi:hypothetical protein
MIQSCVFFLTVVKTQCDDNYKSLEGVVCSRVPGAELEIQNSSCVIPRAFKLRGKRTPTLRWLRPDMQVMAVGLARPTKF